MEITTLYPNLYTRSALATIHASRTALILPPALTIALGATVTQKTSSVTIDLNSASSWDSAYQGYSTAANRAGKDVCVYLVPGGNFLLSPLTTAPTGYVENVTSRKIAGFHCLCLGAGTIASHPLSGFLTGDILPASIWDLIFFPGCLSPNGMVYSPETRLWVDIYLQSGTGTTTASVFGGTITDTRIWNDHVDDLAAVGKRLLWDAEFQAIAEGSNQRTSISGSADPVTTGGHIDTTSRRMISSIGCEDCCGAMWQWLLDTNFKIGGLVDPTVDPAYSWYSVPGSKGAAYRQGTGGLTKIIAGGRWGLSTNCGSRSKEMSYEPWVANNGISSRGCCASTSLV